MIDEALSAQLQQVFGSLASSYKLVVANGTSDKQNDLVELARATAATSDKIDFAVEGTVEQGVRMDLYKEGAPTGVTFRGVPGGHEFTSFVLAILNADGKGKLPDEGIQARVKALKGPARLRTYVSLSCTNCPDVVQALNLVTLLHPGITHEMVDGELHQDDIDRLGIQGVPSVFAGDELVHVGKGNFAELVEILENKLGKAEVDDTPREAKQYDVVVVGGGPAGASAAIYAARKGLRTAIVAQKFGGQVQETLGIENLIGTQYTEGPKLTADLDKHVRAYPIDLLEHRRVERILDGVDKEVLIQGGERIKAPTLIVATGAKWRELGVPGEKEYIGRGVAFCPHCDGPFYKGRPVAVVGGGNSGVEAAIDLSGICTHVTLIEFADALKADAVLIKNLQSRANVTVISSARTTQVNGDGSKVSSIEYEDRKTGETHTVEIDGVFVQIGLSPNSAIVSDLLTLNRFGEIVVDDKGRTSVPGIYAAGDVTTTPFKQIVIAMGDGAKVALTAFEDRMRAVAAE
ncbi:MAG TPA: alkyl hydroperoxide reductase subunit F [Polyangiales bacterium]|nr:alkyl hydroperoxide reductase subunit F [Polyangiales bacterium]